MKTDQFTMKHAILNMHVPDNKTAAHLKQTGTELKGSYKFIILVKILLPLS